MSALDKIALSSLTFVDRISQTELGTLLQFSMDSAPEPSVGLRAQMTVAGGVARGLLCLEGRDYGTFYNETELDDCPAIDVSGLVQIGVASPAPRSISQNAEAAGGIYRINAGNRDETFLGIAARLPRDPQVIGYARLSMPALGVIVLEPNRTLIGNVVIVERNPISTYSS